eukprot:Gb_11865 [translate_table: standard]
MSELVPSVLARKWLGFAAGIWVQAFAGNTYAFPNYSPTLKKVMHYNQLQLNNLGVAKDFGENVGLIAGLICNKLPPWVLLSIGAFNGFIGYGLLWLVTSGRISPLPYWQMCVALSIGANSSTWFNTAVLLTCMRNFPHSRGTVVGILKGFVGLSGAIFAELSAAIFSESPIKLLLLLALGPTIVSLIAMHLIVPVKPTVGSKDDPYEHDHFVFILVSRKQRNPDNGNGILHTSLNDPIKESLLKASDETEETQFGSTRGRALTEGQHETENQIGKSLYYDLRNFDQEKQAIRFHSVPGTEKMHGIGTSQSGGGEVEESLLAVAEGAVRRLKKSPRRGQDFKLKQALVKADFWLLFLSFFCGVGSGVTAINNMGQLGEAQGYSDVSIFISLVGVWNFLGRLGGGSISEYFVRMNGIPRPLWMGIAQGLMIIAHLLFASAIRGSLYVGSAILGICYGVQFTVMVPTASELFGLKHFGIIYNFITLGDPLGSFLFSGLLAGSLYDHEAEKEISPKQFSNLPSKAVAPPGTWHLFLSRGQGAHCTGAHCFRLTFLIMASVCALGVISSLILTHRIRPVYRMLYDAREASNSKFNKPNDQAVLR